MPAYYSNTLFNHNLSSVDQIIGVLSSKYSKEHLDQKNTQTKAWRQTIELIDFFFTKTNMYIPDLSNWGILYEYKIPRRSKKIDAILLSKNLIFVLEVKTSKSRFTTLDIQQLEDYCLDLRDFQKESKGKIIIPILLCTDGKDISNVFCKSADFVQNTLFANRDNLSSIILKVNNLFLDRIDNIDLITWNNSSYLPTPTIIEAAQMLYSGQNVSEISRSHSGVENLTSTTNVVINAINEAKATKSKIICFITGVPGAGKTLAGLNIIHNQDRHSNKDNLGVFLSGNSPLVKVLSEALARNYSDRENENKSESKRKIKTFIQNVHEFIDDNYFDKSKIPIERVIVYDEAQRAWTKEHKTKKSNGDITESEPEILFSIMDRFEDWAIIIALVGGGQEINTGEAGLREWGKAIEEKFNNWKIYISSELKFGDHTTGNLTLFETIPEDVQIVEQRELHLNVSIRAYKAQEISRWVSKVLEGQNEEALEIFKSSLENYPIFITRDIERAKDWLKQKGRGTRRTGIVGSSGARRLRALGYDPFYGLRGDSSQDELGAWYLNSKEDIRSSNFLEIIATEYAVQGLELDWVSIFWDADLRRKDNQWEFKQFRGTSWQNVSSLQKKQYILNKYRVLLTRAREGFIIFVPSGDANDQTRQPEFYDESFEYLKSCGLSEI